MIASSSYTLRLHVAPPHEGQAPDPTSFLASDRTNPIPGSTTAKLYAFYNESSSAKEDVRPMHGTL